jgi:Flp pilus assembly protein TadG
LRAEGCAAVLRQNDGAAAVEFGLVAAPFLALVSPSWRRPLSSLPGRRWKPPRADSARLVMTGQAQTQGFDQAKFKTEFATGFSACSIAQAGIQVDVRTYASFGNVDLSKPIDANGNLVNDFTYNPGGPGDIVVVRLLYQYPVYVSLLGLNLSDMAGGKRLIVATAAFRNEPYHEDAMLRIQPS